MIRSAFFRGFTATDTEVLQAATQILDVPPAELELSRNDSAAIVRTRKIPMMNKSDKAYLLNLAQCLDNAGRLGENEDSPEGARYIRVSDTLAKAMTLEFRVIANRKETDE